MLQNHQQNAVFRNSEKKTSGHKSKPHSGSEVNKAEERARKNEQIEHMVAKYRETGDHKIREKILIANLSLISYISERLAVSLPQSVELDDLKSLGILGLIDAIENYKPEKQVRFTSYAALRIKGSIIDGLRSLDWVPRSVRKKARDLEKCLHELEGELGRPASEKEMSEKLGLLVGGINALPEREKLVIALYYYEGLTLKEIGEVMQISESRVCQIHTEAMLRLRGKLKYTL